MNITIMITEFAICFAMGVWICKTFKKARAIDKGDK